MNNESCTPQVMNLSELVKLEGKAFSVIEVFLNSNDINKLDYGKYEIDADNIFCILSINDLRTVENSPLESHRVYTDLQLVLEGDERIGFKKTAECKDVKIPYSQEKDIEFYHDNYSEFSTLRGGQFVIYTPVWAHAPLIGDGKSRKCVFKIKCGY